MKPEELIPIKTFTELMNSTVSALRNSAFRITNFRPGGVFYTLLEKCNQGVADLYALLKSIAPQMYLDTATEDWLDLKAAEYGVLRKLEQKTIGLVGFCRNADGPNVIIPPGTVVTTETDRYGDRLKFTTTSQAVLTEGSLRVDVEVTAEFAGSIYNVGEGMINKLLTNVPGVDYVTNSESWVTREGTDTESDDSLRQRAKDRWSQLSQGAGDDAYISWAQEIPGVVVVNVDSQHPRGQGTVDVIITGTAGIPSDDLVSTVQEYLDKKKSLIADLLVIKPEPVQVDFEVILYLDPDYGDESEIQAEAESVIDIMFNYGDIEHPDIKKVSPEYGLLVDQVRFNLLSIDYVIKANIISPIDDIAVSKRQLLVKGAVNVTVQRVVA
ncbi:baseplate J/gp47 family protein [Desulfotruncus alcoholivorax]|uniref:baseplate J/gp47 family protein n=1 Tax=Desulfotruncus alcoholivorax TaxID=265477 RepID=UPI0003FF4CC9|nr:baseplate J/gp47 family protein [Desulfotruncus alcoholivorax]